MGVNVANARPAWPVETGREDTFFYEIDPSACVRCGACYRACPTGAVQEGPDSYCIKPRRCIDCGSCSAVYPRGAARPVAGARASITQEDVREALAEGRLYLNPGCALSLYKPGVPQQMHDLLRDHLGDIKLHTICCRHDPGLLEGSVIVNNCAGCDRRFRSLYPGVSTISFWEVADALPDLPLPDHTGLHVSVHDSCGYRHKPQVHAAVRSLLVKMGVEVEDAELSGTRSVCCGDNLYGAVPNERVEARMRQRARQLPCDDVVVYCIGCVRAMESAGKRVHYLPDLLLGRPTEPMPDSLDEYHHKLESHIAAH